MKIMTGRTVVIPLLFVAVGLAGCAEDTPSTADGDGIVDQGAYQIAAGKGAITGLVIDDAFRPITGALVLLQETGDTTTTTENGEFQFLDLEPGQYTLRIDAAGHEASPQQVEVTEGIFAESNIVARRIVAEQGAVLTREFTIFISCAVEAVVVTGTDSSCTADLSEDSDRLGFDSDFTELQDITHMVTESYIEREGDYALVVGLTEEGLYTDYFSETEAFNTHYLRTDNIPGEVSEDGARNMAWEPNNPDHNPFTTSIFVHQTGYEETDGEVWGVGASFGIEAQMIQSVFIGEPEVDLESYCTLC